MGTPDYLLATQTLDSKTLEKAIKVLNNMVIEGMYRDFLPPFYLKETKYKEIGKLEEYRGLAKLKK